MGRLKTFLMDEHPLTEAPIRVRLENGQTWYASVMKLIHTKSALDLALPEKRSSTKEVRLL